MSSDEEYHLSKYDDDVTLLGDQSQNNNRPLPRNPKPRPLPANLPWILVAILIVLLISQTIYTNKPRSQWNLGTYESGFNTEMGRYHDIPPFQDKEDSDL
jgi:hypothetical protein